MRAVHAAFVININFLEVCFGTDYTVQQLRSFMV